MKSIYKQISCVFSILLLTLTIHPQIGTADHSHVEEDLPISVDSAYPIPYLGREFQTYFRYGRQDDGADKFTYEARLEYGIFPNAEIKVGAPYIFGNYEPDGFGDVHTEFLYNFNQETVFWPAFSLAGGVEIPIEDHSKGYDPFIKALLTKTIGSDYLFDQVHLNFAWYFNDDVQMDERDYRYEVIIGYSVAINTSLIFLTDFKREAEFEDDHESNLVEFGLRFQATPLTVISGGVGFGIGDESPDAQITIGLQRAF